MRCSALGGSPRFPSGQGVNFEVDGEISLLDTDLHVPIYNTQADLPPSPVLLLVIKRLILLVVRFNEKIIGPIGEVDAIVITEVAINC
jgi:hypothetical protein